MLRRLFTAASVLSLLLSVCACVLWVGGGWWYAVPYTTRAVDASRRTLGVAASGGRLHVFWISGISGRRPGVGFDHYRITPGADDDWKLAKPGHRWSFAGFREYAYTIPIYGRSVTASDFDIPLWCVGIMGLVMPAILATRTLRSQGKLRQGFCIHCGYDLRASENRCPECGTSIPVSRFSR